MRSGFWVRYLILFLFCGFKLPYAFAAPSCDQFLAFEANLINSPHLKKVMKRVELLDPDLYTQILQYPEINSLVVYLALKERAWEFMPQGLLNWKKPIVITEDLRQSWIANFGHLYKIEQLKPNELGIFYLNSLQSVYSYLSHYVYVELLPVENLRSDHHKTHSFLVLLLESYFMYDLKSSTLDPQIVRGFSSSDYKQINWAILEGLTIKYTQGNISFQQLESEPEFQSLTKQERHLFEKSVAAFENPKKGCCKTSMGCTFCPNNLGFILEK